MRQFYILLIFSLLTSCSVKKRSTTLKQETNTETTTITKVVKTDSINTDIESYELVVEQKDSLKPVSIILNGVENTFYNAKSVTIRKTKKSVREALNESKEIKRDSIAKSIVKEKIADKQKSFEYKALYPIILVLILALIFSRIVKRFTFF